MDAEENVQGYRCAGRYRLYAPEHGVYVGQHFYGRYVPDLGPQLAGDVGPQQSAATHCQALDAR